MNKKLSNNNMQDSVFVLQKKKKRNKWHQLVLQVRPFWCPHYLLIANNALEAPHFTVGRNKTCYLFDHCRIPSGL
jgi:hypothetical protein